MSIKKTYCKIYGKTNRIITDLLAMSIFVVYIVWLSVNTMPVINDIITIEYGFSAIVMLFYAVYIPMLIIVSFTSFRYYFYTLMDYVFNFKGFIGAKTNAHMFNEYKLYDDVREKFDGYIFDIIFANIVVGIIMICLVFGIDIALMLIWQHIDSMIVWVMANYINRIITIICGCFIVYLIAKILYKIYCEPDKKSHINISDYYKVLCEINYSHCNKLECNEYDIVERFKLVFFEEKTKSFIDKAKKNGELYVDHKTKWLCIGGGTLSSSKSCEFYDYWVENREELLSGGELVGSEES